MNQHRPRLPEIRRGSGCLATGVGILGIVILAPFALAVRVVRNARRGNDNRFFREDAPFAASLTRIDLRLDIVAPNVDGFRPRLTDTVVRVAEALRSQDDVYHLITREQAGEDATILPVGPQLQELGERFHLVTAQSSLARRTAVWLTLGRGERVVELVDPFSYDPEAEGEPEALLERCGMRWGMATTFIPTGPSTVFRVVLFVPTDAVPRLDPLISNLSSRI